MLLYVGSFPTVMLYVFYYVQGLGGLTIVNCVLYRYYVDNEISG